MGFRLQHPIDRDYFRRGDFEKLLPVLKAVGDRAKPLIALYIQHCLSEGWEVNLKFVAALIDLGYDVNPSCLLGKALIRVFISQGSSSELYKFLEERGASMKPLLTINGMRLFGTFCEFQSRMLQVSVGCQAG